jgi:hypothetical protein
MEEVASQFVLFPRACGTHGTGEKNVQSFGGKARRRDHSEDQGVKGRMRSEWILGRLAGGVNWI